MPPLKEVAMGDQVPDVAPSMNDGEIRAAFLNLAQAMTSQANIINSQVQDIGNQHTV